MPREALTGYSFSSLSTNVTVIVSSALLGTAAVDVGDDSFLVSFVVEGEEAKDRFGGGGDRGLEEDGRDESAADE